MDSDDGGTSVEIGSSLAGMTLDGELEGLADSETSGSTDVLAVICSVALAESVDDVLEVWITACSAVSAKLLSGILEVLAESQAAGCSAKSAESPESASDSA